MTLKSSISTIKIFDPGTDISYGRTFRTAGKTRIGVLPIGYADGSSGASPTGCPW